MWYVYRSTVMVHSFVVLPQLKPWQHYSFVTIVCTYIHSVQQHPLSLYHSTQCMCSIDHIIWYSVAYLCACLTYPLSLHDPACQTKPGFTLLAIEPSSLTIHVCAVRGTLKFQYSNMWHFAIPATLCDHPPKKSHQVTAPIDHSVHVTYCLSLPHCSPFYFYALLLPSTPSPSHFTYYYQYFLYFIFSPYLSSVIHWLLCTLFLM